MSNLMDVAVFNVPVSFIRQFYFCRRIPFLYIVKNLRPPVGEWVKQGQDFHEKIEKLLRRRDLSKFSKNDEYHLLTELNLYSDKLRMHGRCDAVLISKNSMIPLELKGGEKSSVSKGEELQLTAYAMLLEEKFSLTVESAFIFDINNNSIKVDINESKRITVKNTVNMIVSDCSKGLLPFTDSWENKCGQCEFQNFCADRL